MMKKVATIGLTLAVILGLFQAIGYYNTYYTRHCRVTDVNTETNIVTVKDIGGDVWKYHCKESESIEIGTKVKLVMHNNKTMEDYTDDIIVKVRL